MNIDGINLILTGVSFFKNEEHSGMELRWGSDVGFGTYTIYNNNDSVLKVDNDFAGIDMEQNKEFVQRLLGLLVEQLNVVG